MSGFSIGIVSTYPELSKRILALISTMNLSAELKEGILEEGVKYAYEFERAGVDVIISRGVTGKMIKKLTSLPVVLIDITPFDVLRALYLAKEVGKNIAFLSHRSEPFAPELGSIKNIVGGSVSYYLYATDYEVNQYLAEVLRNNADVVVSTCRRVCDLAASAGVNTILVQSGNGAICSAIERARELAENIHRDRQNRERFRSVLELSNDGILVINEEKRVSFVNPSAEKLLNVEASKILGQRVDSLRRSFLGTLLESEGKFAEGTKEIGHKQFWVKSAPISVGNREQGAVITFQSADRIQVLEHNLRRQLFKKGLVAKHTFRDIIGKSPLIKETIERARKFAATSATVLISGESGTGKELFAQSIHNESKRRNGPFVAVNCAALPENLLESELFGYEEGAFTGARKGGKIGLFEVAHEGTIFLDEIGEMPLPLQARLLRVLQEREIMRLGSDRVIPVNVRIIAATNHNLAEEVEKGKFRNDLYHRLEVLSLYIPPLRARKEDIELLAGHFLKQFSLREGKAVPSLTPAALEKLKKYDWPGNVRELQNLIEKYVLLIENDRDADDLVRKLMSEKISKNTKAPDPVADTITVKVGDLEDMEREIINRLRSAGYGTKEIASLLGTSRTTLWRKLKFQ